MIRKLWERIARRISARHLQGLLGAAITSLFLGIFLKITSEIHEGEDILHIDKFLPVWIAPIQTPWITRVVIEVTALGSPPVLGVVCAIAICVSLFITRKRWDALQILVAATGAGLWTNVGKQIIGRSRPDHPLVEIAGFSYPSGHSLSAAAIYLTLAFVAGNAAGTHRRRVRLGVLALIVIGGVGFSRIYLGVHYPSDVLSGILLGSAWAIFLETARRYYFGNNFIIK